MNNCTTHIISSLTHLQEIMGRAIISHPALGVHSSFPQPSQFICTHIRSAVPKVHFLPSALAVTEASPLTILNSIHSVEKHAKQYTTKTGLDVADSPVQSLQKNKSRRISETGCLLNSGSSIEGSIDYGKAAATLESIYTESPSLKSEVRYRASVSVLNPETRMIQQEVNMVVENGALPGILRNNSAGEIDCAGIHVGEANLGSKRKQRLNLRMRARLTSKRLERLQRSLEMGSLEEKKNKRGYLDIWSSKSDELIKNYGGPPSSMAQDWQKLSYELLSPEEENWLARVMKPMKQLEKLRMDQEWQLGGRFSEERWAKAANMDVHTLERLISLGMAARRKLIQLNLRLVLSQAYKYHKRELSLTVTDLCQEGVKGVILAVEKFNPDKGFRFSTYAIYWIRNALVRAQVRSGHLVRAPFNVAQLKIKIKKAALELLWETGRTSTHEEIIKRLGIQKERYMEVLRWGRKIVSLNEPDKITGYEHVESLEDSTEDGRNSGQLAKYLKGETRLEIDLGDVLNNSLTPKECLVLRQRFGLDGKGERSLEQIGRNLNVSKEMARKYEGRGLLKLKHPMQLAQLRSFLR